MIQKNAAIKLKKGETITISDVETIQHNFLSRKYFIKDKEDKIIFIIDDYDVEFCGLTKYEHPDKGWIPIDEKRPAPEEEVLVCNVHGVIFIGERADFLGKNIFVDSAKTFSTKAAAWMPLPEKYKGAVDNG